MLSIIYLMINSEDSWLWYPNIQVWLDILQYSVWKYMHNDCSFSVRIIFHINNPIILIHIIHAHIILVDADDNLSLSVL